MTIDQTHEQANAIIKGDGVTIGVTEDPSALRRWMIAGSEVSKLVTDYEASLESKEESKRSNHHDQTEQAQRMFFDKVDRLTKVMREMGNPFQEDTRDLFTLDTKITAHPSAAEGICSHYLRGKISFQEFMKGLEK